MPPRILVVDDEPNILGTLAPLLRARGYEVFTAMNGRAALEAVDRDKPDLIVLDLGLPDIDGVEVCRADPRRPRTCRSSSCPRAAPKATRCARSMSAPTTTSPSRLAPKSCWRASAPACGARTRLRRRPNRSSAATW